MIYPRLAPLLADPNYELQIIGLWATPEQIRRRVRADPKWQDGDERLAFLGLNDQVRRFQECELIDTTDLSMSQTAKMIAERVGLRASNRDHDVAELNLTIAEVKKTCALALTTRGVSQRIAARVVDSLVTSELEGHPSHGVLRIIEYVEAIRTGQINPVSTPSIIEVTSCSRMVDGARAFGALTADCTAAQILDLLATEPVAVVGVRNSHHIGRLAHLARFVVQRAHILLGFVNYLGAGQNVAPWGGRNGRFCTNPIVFAFPNRDNDPIIIDMTTSVVSEGKIRSHFLRGLPVPRGWLVNADWLPVTNAADLYTDPPTATLAPLGGNVGYKGFGLSLATEILAGIVTGAGYAQPGVVAGGNGGLFIALNLELLGQSKVAILDSISKLEEYCISCPRATGFESIELPGQRSERLRKSKLRDGHLALPSDLWNQIEELIDSK
jgi:LDH2 family malate/lactate/ureidoglycolate dehydrogenase